MSSSSSPVDFAFEAPSEYIFAKPDDNRSNPLSTFSPTSQFTPSSSTMSSNTTYPFPSYGLGSASSFSTSSFSSASGSGGGSFSSIDALPAISREFTRPSSNIKRPATAHGALQGRSPFAGFMPESDRFSRNGRVSSDGPATVEEVDEAGEGVFTDPFSPDSETKVVPSQSGDVDPHYIPISRRASDTQATAPQAVPPPRNITQTFVQPQMIQTTQMTTQPNMTQFNMFAAPSTMNFKQMPNGYTTRPQTSDGIPSFPAQLNGAISLPSARTIAGQLFQSNNGLPLAPSFQMKDGEGSNGYMPFRDGRAASMVEMPTSYPNMPPNAFPGNRAFSFDAESSQKKPQAGQNGSQPNVYRAGPRGAVYNVSSTPNKSDNVQYEGESDDVTFVPLGGPVHKKRPRRRFDEIERLYACGYGGCEKAYGTLNHLNAHVAMQKHGEKRLPSEFKDLRKAWRKRKREQQAAMANSSYWNQPRSSIGSLSASSESDDTRRVYAQSGSADYSRRDSSSSMTAPDYHRSSIYSNASFSAPSNSAGITWTEESRPTTSSSMVSSVDDRFVPPMPVTNVMPRQGVYYPTNPQYYPAPQNVDPNRRDSMHMAMPAGFRRDEYQTPTQMNPHPGNQRAGFPFLTSGVGMEAVNQGYPGQFAFNR